MIFSVCSPAVYYFWADYEVVDGYLQQLDTFRIGWDLKQCWSHPELGGKN